MSRMRIFQDLFRRYRRPGDKVFAVVFFVFALLMFWQLGEQVTEVSRAKWHAQPGLWPTIAIYGMLVFSALHLVSTLVSVRLEGRWEEVKLWSRSLEFVAYFLIYTALVPAIGYLPATVVFAVFLTVRCGFRGAAAVLYATGFAVVVVIVFRGLLQVKIPAGRAYDLLPDAIRAFALTYL